MLEKFPLGYSQEVDALKKTLMKAGLTKEHFIVDPTSGAKHISTKGTLLTVEKVTNQEGDSNTYFLYFNSIKLASTSDKKGSRRMHVYEDTFPYLPDNLIIMKSDSQSGVVKFSGSRNASVNEAFELLNGALTKDELSRLFFIDDLMSLDEDKKSRLARNIQSNRISADEDIDFGFGTKDSNYFVDNLRVLLNNGVKLNDFSSLNETDQCGFTLRAPFIILLVNNGISFEKLSKISVGELINIENLLSTPQNISKRELLSTKESSFQKDGAVEFINDLLDEAIKLKSAKHTM